MLAKKKFLSLMDRVKDGDGGSEDLGGEKENYQFHPL